MLDTLKSKAITLCVSTITVSSGTTLASFVATASYSDALNHYGWIEASQLTTAVPGQFYVVSDQNEIGNAVCSFSPGEFGPQEDHKPGVRFVNVLGEALPFVSRILGVVAPSLQAKEVISSAAYLFDLRPFKRNFVPDDSLLDHDRQILEDRDIEALRKDLDAPQFEEVMRLESCARAIETRLREGSRVCQLTAVVTDEATGRPLGVTFASSCLATQDETESARLPDLRHYPLWTRVKKTLGLIDARSLPDSAAPTA